MGSTVPVDAIQICAAPICDEAAKQSANIAKRPQFMRVRRNFILFLASPVWKNFPQAIGIRRDGGSTGRLT